MGADKNALSATKLNMLHMGAQGDAAPSIFIFKELGLDINSPDAKGSTPLHWSCFRCSEVALSFLLALGPKLNERDQDGNTPLHLAVTHTDKAESTRMIKFLLIKGADTTIRNKSNLTPIQLVPAEIEARNLARDATRLLSPPGKLACLMLSTPTRKVQKNPTTLIIFIALFASVYFIEVVNVLQHLKIWQIAVNVAIVLTCAISLAYTVVSDPGFLDPKNTDFLSLLEVVDSAQLCPDCNAIRTARSRHCNVCNRCVERFDHHCPWINNCVGVRNHNSFYVFVTSMVLVLLISFVQGIYILSVVIG